MTRGYLQRMCVGPRCTLVLRVTLDDARSIFDLDGVLMVAVDNGLPDHQIIQIQSNQSDQSTGDSRYNDVLADSEKLRYNVKYVISNFVSQRILRFRAKIFVIK
jgi:hypothetical protein